MKTNLKTEIVPRIQARVARQRDSIIRFMREICAIPSVMGRIGEVGKRIMEEMARLGFEDVHFDRMGNVLGRMGRGKRILLYDSHIDTVDVGDRS
ncbi:MAG: YgeY family selenium metabolism-linked hydrolase, partial [Verrucomicrobiia bacterium]